MLKKKKLSVSGNRTPVSRELHQLMTGGDTYHYTNTDLLMNFVHKRESYNNIESLF